MARTELRNDLLNLPNALTMARIAVIPFVCVCMTGTSPASDFIAMLLLAAAAITDWADGWLARRQNLVSMTGKFLDPLADKLLVLAVFCTLLAQDRLPVWFVVLALSREMAITSLRALAAGEGIIIAAGTGGKWKTAFQLTGLILILWRGPWLPVVGTLDIGLRFERIGVAVLMLSLLLSLTSAGRYMMAFLQSVAASGSGNGLSPAPQPTEGG